jgi:hypothetical protein
MWSKTCLSIFQKFIKYTANSDFTELWVLEDKADEYQKLVAMELTEEMILEDCRG